MTEKRYILSHNGKEDGILDKTNDKGYYGFELARLVNELSEENEQLKQEKEELLDKILECQKALSRKRTKEEPHWYKYGNNEGYTKKTDLDIRFCGDVE